MLSGWKGISKRKADNKMSQTLGHSQLCLAMFMFIKHVQMGAASIQSALDILRDSDKHTFLLDNVDKWECLLGKGMNNRVFGLIQYSSIHCKMDCKVLMGGYSVFMSSVGSYITNQSVASSFMLTSGCYDHASQISGVLQQFISRCVVGGWVTYD